jgi:hypothetical protein
MENDRFQLLGYDNPFKLFPAPAVPVGYLNGTTVVFYSTLRGEISVEKVDDDVAYARIQRLDLFETEGFNPWADRLFAINAERTIAYRATSEQRFFATLLADNTFADSNPFLRYALATTVYSRDVLYPELARCTQYLPPTAAERWYASEREALTNAWTRVGIDLHLPADPHQLVAECLSRLAALSAQGWNTEVLAAYAAAITGIVLSSIEDIFAVTAEQTPKTIHDLERRQAERSDHVERLPRFHWLLNAALDVLRTGHIATVSVLDVVNVLRRTVKPRPGVALECDVSLPEVTLSTRPELFSAIVTFFVDDACHFTDKGSVVITVRRSDLSGDILEPSEDGSPFYVRRKAGAQTPGIAVIISDTREHHRSRLSASALSRLNALASIGLGGRISVDYKFGVEITLWFPLDIRSRPAALR